MSATGDGTGPVGSDAAARWDARYAGGADAVPPPAAVLLRHARFLPEAGAGPPPRALDLACGRAGNGEWLAARGLEVHAWDVSRVVVDALRARAGSRLASACVRDVLREPPEPERFDVVVVARFLERSICPAIAAALRPGGTLYFQTFTRGPSSPAFVLGPNELLGLFPGLDVLAYREPGPADGVGGDAAHGTGYGTKHGAVNGERTEAMLVARRPL